MFITRRHPPRRTFLQGMGVTMALIPLLSRNRMVQVVCPIILLIEQFAFLIIYYPSLSLAGPH